MVRMVTLLIIMLGWVLLGATLCIYILRSSGPLLCCSNFYSETRQSRFTALGEIRRSPATWNRHWCVRALPLQHFYDLLLTHLLAIGSNDTHIPDHLSTRIGSSTQRERTLNQPEDQPDRMSDEFEPLPATLQNVLDQKSLKWIFCGLSCPPILFVELMECRWERRCWYVLLVLS